MFIYILCDCRFIFCILLNVIYIFLWLSEYLLELTKFRLSLSYKIHKYQ